MSFLAISLDLWRGFGTSLAIFALTLIVSLPLGLLMMLGLKSRIKAWSRLISILIWIIRRTPLMLQLLVVFFAPGLLFGTTLFAGNRFLAALLTFVINYSGYFAIIFKGGWDSIPRGQWEAGQVLGLGRAQTFWHVILLPMIQQILAPISNEVITLVKDTSLVRVIAVVEIIKVAERYTSQGLIWPLFYTGVFYLAFSALISLGFRWAEQKLNYFERI